MPKATMSATSIHKVRSSRSTCGAPPRCGYGCGRSEAMFRVCSLDTSVCFNDYLHKIVRSNAQQVLDACLKWVSDRRIDGRRIESCGGCGGTCVRRNLAAHLDLVIWWLRGFFASTVLQCRPDQRDANGPRA